MSDRELLEQAAKAAGLNYSHEHRDVIDDDHPYGYTWEPLTDDGDALRLAVKFNFHIELHDDLVRVWYTDRECVELHFNPEDKQDATRRAIVLAAAEAGKGMV